jgi:hypothetical protein
MDVEAYEKLKRDVAAQVDEWFQRDPEHWREKAQQILEQCEAYERRESTFHPILYWTQGWTGSDTTIPPFTEQDAGKARFCQYAACIILHDTAGQGYYGIATDIWPAYEPPVALPTGKDQAKTWPVYGRSGSLWNLASCAFHPDYGDKSDFIDAALRGIEEDLCDEGDNGKPVGSAAQPKSAECPAVSSTGASDAPEQPRQPVEKILTADPKRETPIEKAHKVHRLLQRDGVRERFVEQCRTFDEKQRAWERASETYEAALKPLQQKVDNIAFKRIKCVKEMEKVLRNGLGKTSTKYKQLETIRERIDARDRDAKAALEKAKAGRQEPASPLDWLESPCGHLPENFRRLMDRSFPDDDRGATEESEWSRAYVLTTILHDKALGGARTVVSRKASGQRARIS